MLGPIRRRPTCGPPSARRTARVLGDYVSVLYEQAAEASKRRETRVMAKNEMTGPPLSRARPGRTEDGQDAPLG